MDSGPYDSRSPGESNPAPDSAEPGLESLLTAANVAHFRATPTGRFVAVSDPFVALTGFDESELVGEPFGSVVVDGPSLESLLTALGEDSEPISTRLSMRGKGGDVVPATLHLELTATASGEPTVHGIVVPDTGSAASQTAGPDSEPNAAATAAEPRYGRTFEALADALSDGIIVLDTNSDVQYANPAVERILGYSPDELVGGNKVKIIPPRLRERHLTALRRYLDTGERHINWTYVELPGQHKAGHEVPLGVSLNDFFYEGSRYFVGLFRDISPRKRAEKTMRAKVAQLESVAYLGGLALEHAPIDDLLVAATDAVTAALDADYCTVLEDVSDAGPGVSPDSRELLVRGASGWDADLVSGETVSVPASRSVAGRTLADPTPTVIEDLRRDDRFEASALLSGAGVRSGITVAIGPTSDPWGVLGAYETDLREFADHDVDFLQSVATILTTAIQRQQYESRLTETVADLEASNERLEQFAYAASHDLQEPLRMVSSYLQLIETRYADHLDSDGREFIAFAVDGAERMRDMIHGLLEYSRIDSQGEPFEPVDLDDVVEDVLTDLQLRIDETDAEITIDPLPTVHGDASQLRQLFQNLLSNAIEYSGDDPPRIHVGARRDRRRWRLSIRDEGIGIDPADADRVFRVFQRLHSREAYPGTGIGLAIARRIVERHGGRIWVDSVPGEGATFSVTLPADESLRSPSAR